jgi:hypothetical protein
MVHYRVPGPHPKPSSHPIFLRYILISSHLRRLPSGLFPLGFPTKILYAFLISPLRAGAVIPQSVYRWATGWTIGVPGFDSRWGLGIFFFTASRTALGSTQPPIQCVQGALSLGVKRPGREADHSPPSSAEVKESVELYLHYPNTPSWCGAQLQHRDNFTFTSSCHVPRLSHPSWLGYEAPRYAVFSSLPPVSPS